MLVFTFFRILKNMKDGGSELKKTQEELGITVIEIAEAADLHPQTVYKVLGNYGAGRNSVNRVRKALSQLQEKAKAVG